MKRSDAGSVYLVERKKQSEHMRNKTSTALAWILFILNTVLALLNLAIILTNREVAQTNSQLANQAVWAVVPVEFAFIAALILARQPRNVIGWLVMIPAIALTTSTYFQDLFSGFVTAPPEPTLLIRLAYWYTGWHWLLVFFPIFFILLLFPTGQPPSARWRWVTFYVLGFCVFLFVIIAFLPAAWFEKYFVAPLAVGMFSTIVLSVISIVLRYRGAQAIEREQIKWLAYACGLFAATYAGSLFYNLNSDVWGTGPGWVYLLMALGVICVPAAIGIAILRYRLWDIDVIIRKTLLYAAMTATLGLVFFGGVALLEGVVGRLTGTEDSPVVIVISTLLIAALFSPLRRRIQDFIDRRFYRQKYNAEQALADFAATARSETDLEALTGKLVEVVSQTMQPEQVNVWLAKPGRRT